MLFLRMGHCLEEHLTLEKLVEMIVFLLWKMDHIIVVDFKIMHLMVMENMWIKINIVMMGNGKIIVHMVQEDKIL
jgi:hypothetical protein